MISRRLPIPTLKFANGSEITLNSKICAAIAKLAAENAARTVKVFGASTDPVADLEKLHKDLDLVGDIVKTLEETLDNLNAAIAVLEGTPSSGMSPIEMMALQVKAQIDTLSEMSPDAALYQVDETINTLRSCSVALETELSTTKSRQKKLDYHCRECVGRALENPVHQKSHRIINEMFEAPSHWTLPGGNATSAEIHSAATKALREDVEEARRSKAQNKSVARSELQRNLRGLWE